MNLLRESIGNATKNILRNKLINSLCLGIIAFTLFIYGIFNYISINLENFSAQFSKNIEAIFYFKDNVSEKEIEKLIDIIKDNLLVENVVFKSKNMAEQNFSRQFPELKYILTEFDESPFPSSVEVKFKPDYNLNTKIVSFIEEIENLNIIDSKQVNIEWAKKLNTINKFISIIGIFLSAILIFVSIFIIFNVIKLNIFYRREEISIFKLVGATDWYIKFPFIIEGALLGFFGSILAGLLLFITLKLFPAYASFMFDLFKGMINFERIPPSIFFRLIVLGTSIGLFSSFFSIRRFLKN